MKIMTWLSGFLTGIVVTIITMFYALGSARAIRGEDATTAVWIFVIVGTVVVLLQVIPAFLLFFSFITTVYKKRGNEKEVIEKIEIREPISLQKR